VEAALEGGASQARLNEHAVIVTAPVERRVEILERIKKIGPIRHFETEAPSIEHVYLAYLRESHDAGD
jgi:hypothetical protein